MTPEMIDRLTSISKAMFDCAIDFRQSAKNNKPGIEGRLERLELSKAYCDTIKQMHQFLVDDEKTFLVEECDEYGFMPECPPDYDD